MIKVYPTPEAMYQAAAWMWIGEALRAEPGWLGLATGTTTTPIHAVIAALYAAHPFDTSQVRICAVDDYIGIEQGHIASCAERIRRQIARPLGLADDQVLLPDAYTGESAARTYEAAILAQGGIRMQMLGLGGDGHVGFCYPHTPFGTGAHAVELPQSTREMLHNSYGLPREALPIQGVTLGLRSIMHARRIIIAATGAAKADIIREAIEGPVTERVPASILQLHGQVTWLLDAQAAALLKARQHT